MMVEQPVQSRAFELEYMLGCWKGTMWSGRRCINVLFWPQGPRERQALPEAHHPGGERQRHREEPAQASLLQASPGGASLNQGRVLLG